METSSSLSSSSTSSSTTLPEIPGGTEPTGPIPEAPSVDNDHVAEGSTPFPPSIFESFPRYECHKIVRAGKIETIDRPDNTAFAVIVFGDSLPYATMSPDWMDKHTPSVGGYVVYYEDGYVSYSPAAPFESGYSKIQEQPAELPPIAPGGELAPATPIPDLPPVHSHLELRGMIAEEIERLHDLLNKSGAITTLEVAESKFKRIVAHYL